ncbi:hypothetical protein OROGR_027628 [Orobanche gracilis]
MTTTSAPPETKEHSEYDSSIPQNQKHLCFQNWLKSDNIIGLEYFPTIEEVEFYEAIEKVWSKKNDGIVAVMVLSEDPEVNPRAAKTGRTLESSNASTSTAPPKASTKTLKLKSVERKRMRRPRFQKKSSMKA